MWRNFSHHGITKYILKVIKLCKRASGKILGGLQGHAIQKAICHRTNVVKRKTDGWMEQHVNWWGSAASAGM